MIFKSFTQKFGMACLVIFGISQHAHADGPWGLGPFSTLGTFQSAYEACEVLTRDHLQLQAATYIGFNLKYTPIMPGGLFGTTGATCQAIGQKFDDIYRSPELSIFYNTNYSGDPYNPLTCDYFTEDGACFVANDHFNLGEPLVAQSDGCTGKQGPSTAAGNPINIATGNKYQREVDAVFSGNDVTLALVRHYNSRDDKVGLFGRGWSSDFASALKLVNIYDEREPGPNAQPVETLRVVTTADGRRYEFKNVDGAWSVTSNIVATLNANGSEFIFEDGNRTQYTFDTQGRITQMSDPVGLRTHYQYTGDLLESITDDFGNRISFTFKSGLIETASIAGFGTFTYVYDAQRLTTVKFLSVKSDAIEVAKTYVYDDPNFDYLLTGIIDESNKRYATWGYDEKGRATSSEHGDNGAEKVTIDYKSRIQTVITNANNKEKVYGYVDIFGVKQILQIEDKATENCPAANQQFTYDGRGLLETLTDGEGMVTRYERDDRGLITLSVSGLTWKNTVGGDLNVSDASQEIMAHWYSDFDKPEYVIVRGLDPNGVMRDYTRTDYELDDKGRIKEVTTTDLTTFTEPYATNNRKRTWTYAYEYFPSTQKVKTLTKNGPRAISEIEDGADDVTVFTYNEQGHLTELKNALNHKISYADYNALGQPQTITDENNIVTKIVYDGLGFLDKLTVKTGEGDALTDYDFYANGLLHTVTLPDLSSLTFGYNAARHLTSLDNNFSEHVDLTPDILNGDWETRKVIDSSGTLRQISERVYDDMGRVMHVLGQHGQKTVLRYNSNNQTKDLDEEGHDVLGTLETRHLYDLLGRLKRTTDAKNQITEFGYDGQNRLASITDANTHVTSFVVDGFGDVIQEDSPDRGSTIYWYDEAGNLTTVRDAKNVTTTLKYDSLNRIVSKTDTLGGSVSWQYDLTDPEHPNSITRLSVITDASGNTHYGYTDLGQIASERRVFGNASTTTSYRYDLAGNLTGMTYPGGREVTYTTQQGQVNAVSTKDEANASEKSLISDVRYFPFGPIESYKYENGLTFKRVFDLDGRLDAMTLAFNSSVPMDLDYGYDAFNNINRIDYLSDTARTKTYGYDAVHQLDWANGQFGDIDYEYDSVGNRQSLTITHPDKMEYGEIYIYPWANNRLERVEKTIGTTTSDRIFFLRR